MQEIEEGKEEGSLGWLMTLEAEPFEGWKKDLGVVSVEKREKGWRKRK